MRFQRGERKKKVRYGAMVFFIFLFIEQDEKRRRKVVIQFGNYYYNDETVPIQPFLPIPVPKYLPSNDSHHGRY